MVAESNLVVRKWLSLNLPSQGTYLSLVLEEFAARCLADSVRRCGRTFVLFLLFLMFLYSMPLRIIHNWHWNCSCWCYLVLLNNEHYLLHPKPYRFSIQSNGRIVVYAQIWSSKPVQYLKKHDSSFQNSFRRSRPLTNHLSRLLFINTKPSDW